MSGKTQLKRPYCHVIGLTLVAALGLSGCKSTEQKDLQNSIAHTPLILNTIQFQTVKDHTLLSFTTTCIEGQPAAAQCGLDKTARFIKSHLQDHKSVALYLKTPHQNKLYVPCHIKHIDIKAHRLQIQCQEMFAPKTLKQLSQNDHTRAMLAADADAHISKLMKMTFGE